MDQKLSTEKGAGCGTKLSTEKGGMPGCGTLLSRVSYYSLLAPSLCWGGVAVFSVTMYNGLCLFVEMLLDVFNIEAGLQW